MTVSTTQTKVIYQGDGSTRHWAYTFPIMAEEHIALYVTNPEGQTQRIQSGYQVNSREKIVVYPVQGSIEGGRENCFDAKDPFDPRARFGGQWRLFS